MPCTLVTICIFIFKRFLRPCRILRVLSDDGYVVLTCPDLKSVLRGLRKLDGVYTNLRRSNYCIGYYVWSWFVLRQVIFYGAQVWIHQKTLTESFISAGFAKTATAARGALSMIVGNSHKIKAHR